MTLLISLVRLATCCISPWFCCGLVQFAGYFSVVGFAFVGGVIQFALHVAGLCVPVVGGSPPVAVVGFLFVGIVI